MSDLEEIYDDSFPPADEREVEARDHLREFFQTNREQVFFSRQLEVLNENKYFHWITNRAVRDLEGEGLIRSEWHSLRTKASIKLVWHKGYRFYKRSARGLVLLLKSIPIQTSALHWDYMER